MQKIHYKQTAMFVLCAALFFSCDYKRGSIGDFERVVAFADSSLYAQIRPQVEPIFDQFVYTPHQEKSFYVDWKPLRSFEAYEHRRNLLFIAVLDQADEVTEYIRRMLTPEMLKQAEAGEIFQIYIPDLFAREQFAIILVAKDKGTLRKNLQIHGESIFAKIEQSYFNRLGESMFFKGEQLPIEDYLADTYGWKMRLQYDYQLIKEIKEDQIVWFKRIQPERSLFVYRFKSGPMDDSDEWLINLRDSLSTIYFEKDSVSKDDTVLKKSELAGMTVVELEGVWQNSIKILGGPFRTYALYDEASGYMYIIDLYVTAPGKRKKPYLDQLEVMARSFELTSDPG